MTTRTNQRKHSHKNARPTGQIRIIAGRWRGRKLPVLDVEGLRPTADRVKETLFNWLSPYLAKSSCLDLFAGSGALGFEALSRGAERVIMLEKENRVATQLKQNLHLLSCEWGEVIQGDSLQYLQQSDKIFDIVFIDPPFRKDILQTCCQRLEQGNWLSKKALIYIEREQELKDINLPANWLLIKDKQAGQVIFQLYQRRENE